jgi:sugar lactone lactonase YvrE
MTLDAEDHLWDGWAIERYAPDGGLVEVPAAQATSCAFGAPDLDVLFITTARKDLPAGVMSDQPHAGGLFACRPGVKGRPAHQYAG